MANQKVNYKKTKKNILQEENPKEMQKLWKVYEIGKDMLKIDFTTSELNKIKEEVVFSDLQERIIELKRKEWSNTQICMELSISQSKLSKEIKKIAEKIAKTI